MCLPHAIEIVCLQLELRKVPGMVEVKEPPCSPQPRWAGIHCPCFAWVPPAHLTGMRAVCLGPRLMLISVYLLNH